MKYRFSLALALALHCALPALALPTNAPTPVTHSVTTDINLNLLNGDTNLFNQNAALLTGALNRAGFSPGGAVAGAVTNGAASVVLGPTNSLATATISAAGAINGSNAGSLVVKGGDDWYTGSPGNGGNLSLEAGNGAGANQLAGTLYLGGHTNQAGTYGATVMVGPVTATNLTATGAFTGTLTGNASTATTAAGLSGTVPAAQVTGVLGSGQLPTTVVTNDPAVSAFISAASLSDKSAQDDLAYGVALEKARGAWSSIEQASIFMPRFNASKHISLVGNAWSPTNEVFGAWGTRANGTNCSFVAFPIPVNNFSISICMRVDVAAAEAYAISPCQALLDVFDTNTLSSVVLTAPGQNQSIKIDTSTYTNFYDQNPNNQNSNSVAVGRSGAWAINNRAMPVHFTVYTLSYNSNGVVTLWYNGNPTLFSYLTVTNWLKEMALTTTNLNSLLIGNGSASWYALQNFGGNPHTNAVGTEYGAVIVHTQSCEQNTNIPVADFQMMTALQKQKVAVDFIGASRLWYPANWASYPSQEVIPFTNNMSSIYEVMNPDVLVFNDAYPGTFLNNIWGYNFTNPATSFGVNWGGPFIPSIANLPPSYSRQIIECAGDNDVMASYGIPATISAHNAFFDPYLTNHVAVSLFERGPCVPNSPAQNQALRTYFEQLKMSFPFYKVYDEWPGLSMSYLATVSYDGVHVGGTNTIAGYYGSVALAQLLSDKTVQPFNPQYYSVSSTSLNGTNSMPWQNFGYVMRDTNGMPFVTHDGSGLTNLPQQSSYWAWETNTEYIGATATNSTYLTVNVPAGNYSLKATVIFYTTNNDGIHVNLTTSSSVNSLWTGTLYASATLGSSVYASSQGWPLSSGTASANNSVYVNNNTGQAFVYGQFQATTNTQVTLQFQSINTDTVQIRQGSSLNLTP